MIGDFPTGSGAEARTGGDCRGRWSKIAVQQRTAQPQGMRVPPFFRAFTRDDSVDDDSRSMMVGSSVTQPALRLGGDKMRMCDRRRLGRGVIDLIR